MAGIASIGVVAASLVQWRPTATPSLATALPVIAVMPFETRGAIEPDHLGASLAETIITMLSRAPQIMTIARRSSFSLRDKEGDVRTLGQTLQAGYLLEGSVWRDGDELHVSTRLDDTHSGRQVWAARFVERGKIPTPLLMP
ncbi:hypothetical protein [Paracoccus sp. PAR01]|uniref:hypothetical protein n=1 Tax=Paracoccus sp. PAR01 TaxID=2769282 RepID=UPI001CE08B5A|nr:hypothetical protein [Paracoccus sp. PAR01]